MSAIQQQVTEFLEWLFPDKAYESACHLQGKTLQNFTLEQVDKLAKRGQGADILCRLAYNLLDDDGNPKQNDIIPHVSESEGHWLMTMAKLIHALMREQEFDNFLKYCDLPLVESFGNDFPYKPDSPLEKWLESNPYCGVGYYVCRQLGRLAINWCVKHNGPMQDFCANQEARYHSFSELTDPEEQRQYIKATKAYMSEAYQHIQEGKEQGLDDVSLHIADALWGFMSTGYFHESMVACAQEIKQEADLLKQELMNPRVLWKDLILSMHEKIKEICQKHEVDFGNGEGFDISVTYMWHWVEDYFYTPLRESEINRYYETLHFGAPEWQQTDNIAGMN